jgi:hypothetical protein
MGSVSLLAGAVLAASLAGLLLSAPPQPPFERDVQPVLVQVCSNCHNPELTSGNLNIKNYFEASSLTSNSAGWTKIVARLKAGEMPPPGVPGLSPVAMAS